MDLRKLLPAFLRFPGLMRLVTIANSVEFA
jgi:hypothetical protein